MLLICVECFFFIFVIIILLSIVSFARSVLKIARMCNYYIVDPFLIRDSYLLQWRTIGKIYKNKRCLTSNMERNMMFLTQQTEKSLIKGNLQHVICSKEIILSKIRMISCTLSSNKYWNRKKVFKTKVIVFKYHSINLYI